ncbi:MAG: Flp pilus assembly protein CpaB [Bdellovibrionales bacterium]|nr:Flp pilus assembly protein CpaB [Bdellovibrionales bacterium]
MATRFGSSYSTKKLSRQVRWIIACLSGIILVLCGTLAMVLLQLNESENQTPPPGVALASDKPPAPTTTILTARRRIEVGEQLTLDMFNENSFLEALVPQDAIRADQREFLIGKFSTLLLDSGASITKTSISNKKPISALYIPPGYRAFTILVDPRSGVEGYAKPGSRVDVLWSFLGDDKQRQVASVVRYSRVLSVAGATEVETMPSLNNLQTTTVTLLVTENDAKRLELARSLGQLSLSLVGDSEPLQLKDNDRPVTIADIIPQTHEPEDPNYSGSIFYRDPVTGKMMKYLLDDRGRWKQEEIS